VKPLLFLSGFAGTGKTTVGRLVAQRLGWAFIDTDEFIAAKTGRSIPQLFQEQGEPAFRALESEALAEAAKGQRAVLREATRELMAQGLVVCLAALPETILARLQPALEAGNGEERPLLVSADPLERIRSLKAEREAAYASAHWTVHTDNLSPQETIP
jgi:shikimate kinase